MENKKIKEIISQIKQGRTDLKNTYMRDLIEASTNHKAISYAEKHKSLLQEIHFIGSKIVEKYSKSPVTRQIVENHKQKKINAFRNNEVGDFCEVLIKETFDKNKFKFKIIKNIIPLGGKGYPDLKILTKAEKVFLEIKATSRPDKGSARDFYYSLGVGSERKIDTDALHILVGFITKQVQTGFLITDFKLVDVSKIKVSLKPEFNTDNLGIYNSETIIQLSQTGLS